VICLYLVRRHCIYDRSWARSVAGQYLLFIIYIDIITPFLPECMMVVSFTVLIWIKTVDTILWVIIVGALSNEINKS
jgi:hypothetical protein